MSMINRQELIEAVEKEYHRFIDDDRDVAHNRAIYDVLEIIKAQPPADQWISCSERLPEDQSKLYWTTHEDGSVIQHGYCKDLGFIYNWEVDDLEKRKRQGGVIAWMPNEKPEPYKGVE